MPQDPQNHTHPSETTSRPATRPGAGGPHALLSPFTPTRGRPGKGPSWGGGRACRLSQGPSCPEQDSSSSYHPSRAPWLPAPAPRCPLCHPPGGTFQYPSSSWQPAQAQKKAGGPQKKGGSLLATLAPHSPKHTDKATWQRLRDKTGRGPGGWIPSWGQPGGPTTARA